MLHLTTRSSPFRRVRIWIRSLSIGFHPVLGGLMLLLFGFHLLTYQTTDWWGDSYQYLLHAENLLSGHPYADTGYVQSPYKFTSPTAYPIGYPLLIAPVLALFGADPFLLSAYALLFILGTAWVTGTLARGWLPDPYAIALAGLIALQPGLIAASRQPLSDPPFMFFAMLCLLAADRASYGSSRWPRWAVLAGLALGAAAITRTLGLALIPALVLPSLLRHRRVEPSALVAVGLGCVLWFLASLFDVGTPEVIATGASPGYQALVQENLFRQLADIPGRIPERMVDYLRNSYPLWRVPGADLLKNLFFAVAFIPIALGFLHRARRRFGPVEAFAALYVLSLLPWTFSGTRYLYPLFPLYYLYLLIGVWRLGRDSLGRMWLVNTCLAAAIALSYGGRYIEGAVKRPNPVVNPDHEEVYQYIRATTPEESIFLSTGDPRPPAYHIRRNVSRGPEDLTEWLAYADRLNASYALVLDENEIATDLLRNARHRVVLRSGDLTLYQLCPTTCAAPSAP